VIAAGLLLTTITGVSLSVGAALAAEARLERVTRADRAVRAVAEHLRSLPFCAPSLPAPPDEQATGVAGAVFAHARTWKNTPDAWFDDGGSGDAPGSFVTVWREGGVEVECTAWFLRGAGGPRLSPVELAGWDVTESVALPGPGLEVVVSAVAPGGVRSVRLMLSALPPVLSPREPEAGG
jgi:hypothetical protein